MENIQHIHEVLHLIFNTEKEYAIADLYSELKSQFGEDVHFANCANNAFPIQAVVPFLRSKNKIRLSENRIIPITSACSH